MLRKYYGYKIIKYAIKQYFKKKTLKKYLQIYIMYAIIYICAIINNRSNVLLPNNKRGAYAAFYSFYGLGNLYYPFFFPFLSSHQ